MKTISVGYKLLKKVFRNRLRYSWNKIILCATEEFDNKSIKNQLSKLNGMNKIIHIKRNILKKFLVKWKKITMQIIHFETAIKYVLKNITKRIIRLRKENLLKAFNVWRYKPYKIIKLNEEELCNENIMDDEEMLSPNKGIIPNSLNFESVIETNASRIYKIVKSYNPSEERPQSNSKEIAAKKQISDLCVNMALKFIDIYTNH